MRFTLALDERTTRDKLFEVKGVPFVMDSFTAQIVRPPLTIVYDKEFDSFTVLRPDSLDGGC